MDRAFLGEFPTRVRRQGYIQLSRDRTFFLFCLGSLSPIFLIIMDTIAAAMSWIRFTSIGVCGAAVRTTNNCLIGNLHMSNNFEEVRQYNQQLVGI